MSAVESRTETPIFETDPPYRVLSMDGGGIYGLFTAIMLRELCHRDKAFLSPVDNPIALFAGCSAGALKENGFF